ncbi:MULTISPECIES: 16S rRNA (cytidine(1402)-2'-O)-methyltransferase [Dethiosulfovibrio]|jgi:16S rRNA (cytidine1402-2'-O)-methyltransferase|uniref:Ribosomal RNA small subunit methyltransferase I n=2 Tax=Dethiosulfovibrio TaxID=47054 RepID=A0ABS9EJS5_9BACT|nr:MULTISPECIES: 16S rRNA (cytidine(1402)-2'-O)-methyltransferase [Dethiosulfovibrio]MCF4112993.1 16S rRNA (cytidine(1402)-2'-O)-methyltransferase [Dethiosulfovibrio russensis]MCF4141457.1 16S rRNA (cytidine(1402)-2'-O)-methyltransferase [Dethiosulfovibrio marinus]MCF4144413.1 16S rRNA (cytidine(1402)-2'-O)-methyltransferase [Dethiosulfovibrio acidaminovorans]
MPLIVIPTPVGNMDDITLRALEELGKADVVACEDTRHSGLLLKRHGIDARLLSYHKHNEAGRSEELLDLLARDKRVALISDAGTPGISDPGYEIVRKAVDEGFEIDVLPGATAFVPALILSGLPPHPCLFFGFLSDREGDRTRELAGLKDIPWTLVFYVSPHKVVRHLESMISVFGDRKSALVREISKIHQEALRGSLTAVLRKAESGLKGEMVLIVEGGSVDSEDEEARWKERALDMVQKGMSLKDVTLALSEELGIPKNPIKKWLLGQKGIK